MKKQGRRGFVAFSWMPSLFFDSPGTPQGQIIVEIWSSVLMALLLFVGAGWLIDSHLRTWRKVRQRKEDLEPHELDYRRRQFRRRMQTSAMLGLVGAGILVCQLVSLLSVPRVLVVVLWGGVMLLVLWLVLLAVADAVSTRLYFNRVKRSYVAEEARLHAELRRLRRLCRIRGNGQDDKHPGINKEGTGQHQPDSGDQGPAGQN